MGSQDGRVGTLTVARSSSVLASIAARPRATCGGAGRRLLVIFVMLFQFAHTGAPKTAREVVEFVFSTATGPAQRIGEVLSKKAVTIVMLRVLAGPDGLNIARAGSLKVAPMHSALTTEQGLGMAPVGEWRDAACRGLSFAEPALCVHSLAGTS